MNEELVIVYSALSEAEAEIVRGRLEANDIAAIVQGESLGTIYGFTGGPLGTLHVLVRPEDEDAARRLLDSPGPDDENAQP